MYIPDAIVDFFGIIAVIAGFILFVYLFDLKRRKIADWEHMIRKSDYWYEYDQFIKNNNKHYDDSRTLRQFIALTGKQKIVDSYNHHVKMQEEMEDNCNKRWIKARVFGYQYEDLIFSLFSELAQKKNGEWCLPDISYIPEEKVLDYIQKYYNVDTITANSILKILVDNDMLDNHLHANQYDMGHVLKYHPNIISKSDMNFSKWMNNHTQA